MPTSKAYLQQMVDGYLAGAYETYSPRSVPAAGEIPLGNTAAMLTATALFIDLRQSSDITNSFRRQTAAKMLKSFIGGSVRIIGQNGGSVRSFNGDGMLAIFTGDNRTTPAAKAAMQIDWFVTHVLWPKFNRYFEHNQSARGARLDFSFGAGIDDGDIYAVSVGIRGTNDIAWVGRCTNTAAKLSNVLHRPKNIAVTREAYARLNQNRRVSDGRPMWSDETSRDFGGVLRRYRTTTWYTRIA